MELNKSWLDHFYTVINDVEPIPRQEFDKVIPLLKVKELAKNGHLVMPGDEEAKIGFIVKGLLRSYIIRSDGTEFNTDFCLEGYITGNYDIFLGHKKTNQALQALEDTILLMLDYRVFEKRILPGNPVWQSLVRTLVQGLYIDKSQREEDLLILDGPAKYDKFMNQFKEVARRIPQFHIAAYLGITPEALSRIKKSKK